MSRKLLRFLSLYKGTCIDYTGSNMSTSMCWKKYRDNHCYFYCRDYFWCIEAQRRSALHERYGHRERIRRSLPRTEGM
jgi:hypothetical protein